MHFLPFQSTRISYFPGEYVPGPPSLLAITLLPQLVLTLKKKSKTCFTGPVCKHLKLERLYKESMTHNILCIGWKFRVRCISTTVESAHWKRLFFVWCYR